MLILPKQARFGDLPRNVSRCISVCTRFRYLSGEGVSVSTFGCLSGKTTKLNSPFSSEQVFKLRNVCPLSTKAENYVKKGKSDRFLRESASLAPISGQFTSLFINADPTTLQLPYLSCKRDERAWTKGCYVGTWFHICWTICGMGFRALDWGMNWTFMRRRWNSNIRRVVVFAEVKNTEWTDAHDIQLAREVLVSEPFRFKPRTVERGKV
ncbi:hypothetical protein P5673_012471 [Acropora cervicornis]|uniref:Uncharacterized protein n=1 Tax=Acropora cervicornis TaxID=6130 RepID=A0AAD9QMU5_ACRCE|nr:hypothetical protein P5673_012471 [Acropora cervicornis]